MVMVLLDAPGELGAPTHVRETSMGKKTKTKKKRRKKSEKRARAYTQRQLADLYDVQVCRQPNDEILVFEFIEHVGERTVRYNFRDGAYKSHIVRVNLYTEFGVLLEYPRPGILDIPVAKWNRAKEELDLGFEIDCLEQVVYTLEADKSGEILSFEEGNLLDEDGL